jgi:tetratricopeptide (TPR) repeat protein
MRLRLFFTGLAISLATIAIAAPPSIRYADEQASLKKYAEAVTVLRKLSADKMQPPAIQKEALQKSILYGLEHTQNLDGSPLLVYRKTIKEDFRALLLLLPEDGALYYNYGVFLDKELGESTLAANAFEKAFYLGNRSAAVRLGELYFERREYENASSALQIATELHPSDYLLWFDLGRSQYLLNDFEAATASLEKAYELNSLSFNRSERLFEVYSQALLKVERYSDAIAVAKKYLKFYNDAEGYLFVASIYSSANQPENAIFYYTRALEDAANKTETQPQLLPKVLNNYAWFFCTTKDKKYQSSEYLTTAFQMATKAVADSKRLHTYLDTLAEVYYLLGYPEEAIALEQEAAKKSPSNTFYVEQLAKYELALDTRPSLLVDPEVLQPPSGTLLPEKASTKPNPNRPLPKSWSSTPTP